MTNANTTTEHTLLSPDAAIAAMDAMIAGDDAVAHTGDDAIAAIDEVVGDDDGDDEATADADDADGYWEICDANGQSYGVYQGDTEAEAMADLHIYQAWTVELSLDDVTITRSDYAAWVADQ